MKLKCPICGYIWNYKGNADSEDFICCPKKRHVKKRKNYIIVSEETTQGESNG